VALSAAHIGQMFRIQAEQVRKIRCKAGSKGKDPHQPSALDANQQMAVVYFIRAGYASGSYVIS
jgi:hypothetical protein